MKRSSRTSPGGSQRGYALLLMVLALMGIGGVVLVGFTQGAKVESEQQRYLHNQRVLEEAKQALLQYAFNYPVNNPGRGPGRLPCPDTDNSGSPNSSFNCISGTAMVGRFPWNDPDLNFYDALDASGARLWYAVSKNFANSISPIEDDVINSDTQGSITIQDRSGAILYDGSIAGVAAVIIAPGAPIARNGVMQVRGTADEKKNVINYLDLFGTVDNADFVNDDPGNGFVTGPIHDVVTGDLLVNDQMIVITAAEVHAMAEMATLQAYRDAIRDYLNQVACTGETPEGSGASEAICVANGGSWAPVYPWLYNYKDVATFDDLSILYPAFTNFTTEADYLSNYGRIPSIFADYFALGDSDSLPIESELNGTLQVDYSGLTVSSSASGNQKFNDGVHTLNFPISGILPDVRFLDDLGAPNGRLTATVAGPQTFNQVLYFWDLDHGTTGFWTACPSGGDELSDCHRDAGSSSIPGGDNNIKLEILRVDLQIVIPDGQVTFDANYSSAPTILVTSKADGGSHATIAGTYAASNMDFLPSTAPVITATYQIDRHYHEDDDDPPSGEGFIIEESGDLTVAELLGNTTMTLEMRYYPELPRWALDNGWHNSIRMAYADTYLPSNLPAPTDCEPLPLPPASNDCLSLPDEQGARRDIASLLVIAGEHDWVDEEAGDVTDPDYGMADELRDVFDDGNQNNNRSFSTARGNDQILIIAEP